MYEESFEYLSHLLVRWFKTKRHPEGQRFCVQFEDTDAVRILCRALEECASSSFPFGEDFSISVIAGESSAVAVVGSQMGDKLIDPGFLTKIRNAASAQTEGFQGKSLLIVDHTGLDSIIGGCTNLAKEGYPLHAESLREELRLDINASSLPRSHKDALYHLLLSFRRSTHEDTTSVFAYIPFMNVLNKTHVSVENWNNLGLFHDAELTAFSGKPLKSRIDKNAELFDVVKNSHHYGNPSDDLQKSFTTPGVNALKADEWMREPYTKVAKWNEDRTLEHPAVFQEVESLEILEGLQFWPRPEGNTAAASRKHHVLVFNPDHQETVVLPLLFDDTLRSNGIKLTKSPVLNARTSGKKLIVTIPNCGTECVIDRVSYQGKKGSATVFNIAVVPCGPDLLADHKTTFLVNGAPKSRRIQLYEEGKLVFHPREEEEEVRFELGSEESVFELSPDCKTVIETDNADPENDVQFELSYKGTTIRCEIYRERVKPRQISGINIWKRKREECRSFEYPGENKLVFGTEEFFTDLSRTNRFLGYEKQIIEEFKNDCFWVLDGQELHPRHIGLDDSLVSAYQALTAYYRKHALLPSLAHVTPELQGLMSDYVMVFEELLDTATPGKKLPDTLNNVMRVGTIESADGENTILLTPLHPLLVAYQLELLSQTGSEKVPEEILRCLSPAALMPYLNDPRGTGIKYCAVRECELPEWLVYKPHNSFNRGWHDEYVEGLIADKISEYTKHFHYFFTGSAKAPIRINLVNMGDCTDALKGIIRYFVREIKNPPNDDVAAISPVELHIHGGNAHANKFEAFARYADASWIERDFEISLQSGDCSSADVLAILQEKLHFYLKPKDSKPDYAHLTFFRFDPNSIEWTYHQMAPIRTGVSLQGLISAVPSVFRGSQYLTGYGKQDYPSEPSHLLQFAGKLNVFARVAFTQDPYSKDEATFAALKAEQKQQLEHLYNASNWITLIDPKVDLNFFKMHEKAGNLVIIHYSDQYNNTSGYDAITVTRKCHQYQGIIKEFFRARKIESMPDTELSLINMFNALNGDWLLRLISGGKYFPKEKISILSAVRTMLAFFKHPNITWIPVSLEEVLRVSGSVGLRKGDGLFSAKNLGSERGNFCDDLLMAGVERCGETVKVHLLPVEVKIGQNQSGVIEKAKKQGLHTAQLLRDFLTPPQDSFRAHFYRAFFAKMILVGADKMSLYGVCPDADWKKVTEESRSALLNDEFEIDWCLEQCLAKCCVLSFRDECIQRSAKIDEGVLLLDMPEEDGHRNLLQSVADLAETYDDPAKCTIDRSLLLCNCYTSQQPCEPVFSLDTDKSGQDEPASPKTHDVPANSPLPLPPEPNVPSATGMEILFGHEVNYNEPVIWYPNDTNKVMHSNTGIIGTMGTGKTQFTQSMIAQMVRESKNNVNGTELGILIFDYKGDYIKDDFAGIVGAKKFKPLHLPYNPLALTLSESPLPKLPLHTANAITESICKAFQVTGQKQKFRLLNAIMRAYDCAGINPDVESTWKKAAPTLQSVFDVFFEEDAEQDTLYAAMHKLHSFGIFEPDVTKTVSLWNLLDGVVVIDLSGYDQNIQNFVVAITLDLFYSQMQKAGHSAIQGNLRELTKIVLVDEADNFLSQDFAVLRRILKEGREFGVGTILSTQFLDHFSTGKNDYAKYILTWIVHCVNAINHKDTASVFKTSSKQDAQKLADQIKDLQKHFSIAALGGGKGTMIRDRAFWELLEGN
jgi:DNA phosphorothioation-dependent restriction protein DptH